MEKGKGKNLEQAIKERAKNGKLPCVLAFALADEFSLPLHKVRESADKLQIKIIDCQLGCF